MMSVEPYWKPNLYTFETVDIYFFFLKVPTPFYTLYTVLLIPGCGYMTCSCTITGFTAERLNV
jgi:hypothetical protein